MNIYDVRQGKWYRVSNGPEQYEARRIDIGGSPNTTVFLAGYGWANAADIKPVDAPMDVLNEARRMVDKLFHDYPWLREVLAALLKEIGPEPAPDLEQRVAALEDRLSTPAMANPAPTPSEPLAVGDTVWVKGMLVSSDKSAWPYEIDFGHNASLWVHKSTEIKHA